MRALTLPRRAVQALSDIESLKAELEGARVDRKHKEEYEVRLGGATVPTRDSAPLARQVLRKQCLAFPSRADTQAAIAGVVQDIAALEQESAATAATVEVRAERPARGAPVFLRLDSPLQLRQQQFRDLLESVDKLARALEEDGPVQPLPSAAAPMQVDA